MPLCGVRLNLIIHYKVYDYDFSQAKEIEGMTIQDHYECKLCVFWIGYKNIFCRLITKKVIE